MATTKYLSQADLTTLANRIETVFLKSADFNTAIADYSTTTQMNSAIASAISGVTQFDYEVVETLPAEGVKGVIYLVPNTGSGANMYDEYFWIVSGDPAVGHFELFGAKELTIVEYKGSATVSVTDGTGADAGKKVISVTYNTDTLTEDANGLDLSATTKASLALANSAVQGFTSTDGSVVVTGDGTTKDLAVSPTIQAGAAAGANAVAGLECSNGSITIVMAGQDGKSRNIFISQELMRLIYGAVQKEDDNSIGATVINDLWTD